MSGKLGYTWYPKDFISDPDVMFMTSAERGVYRDLIDLAYMSDNKIEHSIEKLARYTASDVETVKNVLASKGKKKGEVWTIPSCQKRIDLANKNRANGDKGGRPKVDHVNKTISGIDIPETIDKGHFIYLIYDKVNKDYKIGETGNLKNRRQTIKRPSANLVVYHFEIKDSSLCKGLERFILNQMRDKVISGDWMHLNKEDLSAVIGWMKMPFIPANIPNNISDVIPNNIPELSQAQRQREIEREREKEIEEEGESKKGEDSSTAATSIPVFKQVFESMDKVMKSIIDDENSLMDIGAVAKIPNPDDVSKLIEEFCTYQKATEKFHTERPEFKRHFFSWYAKKYPNNAPARNSGESSSPPAGDGLKEEERSGKWIWLNGGWRDTTTFPEHRKLHYGIK